MVRTFFAGILMTDVSEKIFLTREQAIKAIRIDFYQYPDQFDLFQSLCPVIIGDHYFVARESRTDCVLMARGKKSKARRLTLAELARLLAEKVAEKPFSLEMIGGICGNVFQTESWSGTDTNSSAPGIWIRTDMRDFQCRQCGNCCRNLSYHKDCTASDYNRWKMLGRADILDKIKVVYPPGSKTPEYRIWVTPETGQFYDICPWLVRSGRKGRYACRIQEIKPEYCRQYPLTRKHATMTGCQGTFENK
jgi:Fe-S-cluster containining protein